MRLYIAAGALIIALGLLSGLLYYRGTAIKSQAALKQSEATVRAQKATITKMDEANKANQVIIVNLNNKIAAQNKERDETLDALSKLKRTDPDAAKYLDTRLPDSVSSLLNTKATRKLH